MVLLNFKPVAIFVTPVWISEDSYGLSNYASCSSIAYRRDHHAQYTCGIESVREAVEVTLKGLMAILYSYEDTGPSRNGCLLFE
jgi:hypothetical protein